MRKSPQKRKMSIWDADNPLPEDHLRRERSSPKGRHDRLRHCRMMDPLLRNGILRLADSGDVGPSEGARLLGQSSVCREAPLPGMSRLFRRYGDRMHQQRCVPAAFRKEGIRFATEHEQVQDDSSGDPQRGFRPQGRSPFLWSENARQGHTHRIRIDLHGSRLGGVATEILRQLPQQEGTACGALTTVGDHNHELNKPITNEGVGRLFTGPQPTLSQHRFP